MTHLFYLASIIFLFVELRWIYAPIEKTKDSKRFHELNEAHKGKKWDEYSQEYKSELKGKLHLMFILLWMFIGLFTFQWPAFLLMLLFSALVISPLSKITRFGILYTALHWVNSLIGFGFAVFIIINKYHLHINVLEFIKKSIGL